MKKRIVLGAVMLLALTALALACAGPTEPTTPTQPTTPPPAAEPGFESARLFTFPGNWGQVQSKKVTLFYPAQASWEFVTSPQHPGSSAVNTGTGCLACHQGQEATLGQKLVSHATLEPDPIPGKKPTVDVDVKAAIDDQYLYMRFEYAAERPGVTHSLWRYNGTEWKSWGGPKPETAPGVDNSYEDRIALNIADSDIPAFDGAPIGFEKAGCFITCHNSMRAMPNEPTSAEVKAHPYFGDEGLKRTDIRKYLLISRTETDVTGGWDKTKSAEEIKTLLDEGQFLDLWQWRGARSGPIGYGDDSYVLEYRKFDPGKGIWSSPAQPEFMYDESKTGFKAIPESEFEQKLRDFPMVSGQNVVPLDPSAIFKEGDILSKYILQTPDGSRADLLFNSTWTDGKWVVEMRRALNTGNPEDKVFAAGKTYNIGIAIFHDMVSNRRHHVSFPLTLGIDTAADIKAASIK
ncbi:MAG: ethylbenzene dehydrogenase-related protein [Dehalococcoidales bacterium]|nr:ethylbenzene dehydrogenase-related protein [Dehalococcoidales bacterium]